MNEPAPVVRWQMVSADPDRVATFYEKAFGWRVAQNNNLGYREVTTGGGIDGGIWPAPPGQTSLLQLFIAVPDIDQAIERAVALGARLIVPKAELPDGDAIAVLADPTGHPVGLATLRKPE